MPIPRFLAALTGVAAVIAAVAIGQLTVGAQEPDPAPAQPAAAAPAGAARPVDLDATIDAQLAADAEIAAQAGLEIGPMDSEAKADDQPDLVPVIGERGVIGYARVDDLLADELDPSREFLALAVYGPDGSTLRGHEIPGKGFVAGTEPIETSRPAVLPAGRSPLGE